MTSVEVRVQTAVMMRGLGCDGSVLVKVTIVVLIVGAAATVLVITVI